LKAALTGWIASEDDEAIRHRAAQAYDKVPKVRLPRGLEVVRHELKKTLERVALDSLNFLGHGRKLRAHVK